MSDRIYDISKSYKDNVCSGCSRSNGLFPIPEYPEYQKRRDNGMWSSAYEVILTTLRYLAPATLLTVFWGQQSLIFRLLRHIDLAIRSIVFSSNEQRQSVLKWLEEAGPVKVEHLETVWRHGWILCGVLDSALPGACAGHPPTRLSLKHAQSIADDYLGVEPVFSNQELESSDVLGKRQEWKLAQYLDRIREAIGKLTPPVSKPNSQRTSPENNYITMDYVCRGSGLTAAQINNKMYFKIYPTAQQSLDPGEIMILIKGPKDIYGMAVIPPLLGKAQMIRQKLLGLQEKKIFTENALPITHGVGYLRSYGKNDMNKTFHIPKASYDIDIGVEIRTDCARIGYIVPLEGKYEIYITSKGSNIVGSPYNMTASKNIIEILEKDSFCLEDGEEIDILDVKTDRRVILRIVDFVTEKMLLKENGTFEKISEEEAKLLMSMDKKERKNATEENSISSKSSVKKFKDISKKVKIMINVCNIWKEIKVENNISKRLIKNDIPDVVNSTLNDTNVEKDHIPQLIIPNSLTLLLKHERIKTLNDSKELKSFEQNKPKQINNVKNQFHECENFAFENAFIMEENLSDDAEIKIIIDEEKCESPNTNPFVNFVMDRPKTPVLKIITGQLDDRPDTPYIDKTLAILDDGEDINCNEFINPFFVHEHRDNNKISHLHDFEEYPTADFIIGAPVSLPPTLKAPSPEPDMESIILASNLDEALYKYEVKMQSKKPVENNSSLPLTHSADICESFMLKNNNHILDEPNSIDNLTFHSLDSNLDNESQASSEIKSDSCGEYCLEDITCIDQDIKSQKETWDSAYVSIDDNCSPDISNADGTIETLKQKNVPEPNVVVYSNMGPAERELWESCQELGSETIKEQMKATKWEFRRPIFTPIIEESDRSLSTGLKDSLGPEKLLYKNDDSVTKSPSELNSLEPKQCKEVEIIIEQSVICVDSASENKSDVMRQRTFIPEGTISEVQEMVTEFSSASRALQDLHNLNLSCTENTYRNTQKSNVKFGDDCQTNLVLERKKYWDEKIKVIEEINSQQKQKIQSLKQHNRISPSEKKWNQSEKNITPTPEPKKTVEVEHNKENQPENNNNDCLDDDVFYNVKLVQKWKKFWDEKLITEAADLDNNSEKNTKTKCLSGSLDTCPANRNKENDYTPDTPSNHNISLPNHQSTNKQEIAEEVFKAFETSPKRFFGTSRKHIMNKLDLFVTKDEIINDKKSSKSEVDTEHGIVSNRITQFYGIKCENDEINKNKYKGYFDPNETNVTDNSFVKDEGIEKSDKSSEKQCEQPEDKQQDTKGIIKRLNDKFLHENTDFKSHKVRDKTIHSKTSKHKLPASKSEMDIFSKVNNKDISDEINEKYKSCEELPKVNVKNVISLYESVSKNIITTDSIQTNSSNQSKTRRFSSNNEEPNTCLDHSSTNIGLDQGSLIKTNMQQKNVKLPIKKSENDISTLNENNYGSFAENKKRLQECFNVLNKCKQNTKRPIETILTDIDIEIVENDQENEKNQNSSNDKEIDKTDYKSRFMLAKEYFKSLEDLRQTPEKKLETIIHCEIINDKLTESPKENDNKKKQKKKGKSHSLPSSEFAKTWSEMQEQKVKNDDEKYVKISDKFNVDDLFNDVIGEGRLSRQGSFKGIPHKKAVLEMFKSMENISDKSASSYDIALNQLADFAKEKNITNVQTYLTEYPYLPTTDPSKYHSRRDTKASGLISRKEMLNKPRRNSVPDLRMNAKFIVNL